VKSILLIGILLPLILLVSCRKTPKPGEVYMKQQGNSQNDSYKQFHQINRPAPSGLRIRPDEK